MLLWLLALPGCMMGRSTANLQLPVDDILPRVMHELRIVEAVFERRLDEPVIRRYGFPKRRYLPLQSVEQLRQIGVIFVQFLCDVTHGRPQVIVAETIKGKGVSFMENNNEWHSGPTTPEQTRQALQEIQRSGE